MADQSVEKIKSGLVALSKAQDKDAMPHPEIPAALSALQGFSKENCEQY